MIDSSTYLNSFKTELDDGASFVDYFLVIGIKPETFKESFLYESSLEDLNGKYKEQLSPSIISMFPPFQKKTINVDETIINHIFPNDFTITNIQPAPVTFSIVLDNKCLSTKFPYKYFACLVFYEKLTAYKTLYDISVKLDSGNRPSSTYTQNNNSNASFMSSLLPSLSLTTVTKKEDYTSYYVPKCICFASVHPFIDSYLELLLKLHSFSSQSKDNRNKISIDKLIENIIIEIPCPPRGLYSILFNFTDKYQFEYKQSLMNELPCINVEFEKVFKQFKVETISEILKYLLLEVKLIFFSEDIRNLTPIILGFLAFISPFKYPNLIISILPKKQYNYIESISPNIYGVNDKYSPSFFKDNNINLTDLNIVIINIDQGTIEALSSPLSASSINRLSQKRKSISEEHPELPKPIRNKLEKRLSKYISDIRSGKERENRSVYLDCFYCFMSSLLSTYCKYIIQDSNIQAIKKHGDISSLFNAKDYYMSFNGSERTFYKRLTETKMFIDFISQRLFPRTSNEILEMVYFDERINEKVSKNIFSKTKPSLFIGSNEYERTQTYQVSNCKQLSIKDIDFFRQSDNRQLALLKGQYCEILNNDEIIFTYYIFPSLLTEYLFNSNIDQYYVPPFCNKYVEEKNNEIISKINTDISINHISVMENYIYLCWVNMWALSFWYHSQDEREFRFSQLLTVLDKLWNHELQLFVLLFEVLKQLDEKTMIIILYAKLIKYRLNPSWEIYSMITNIIDRDQLPLMIQTLDKAKEQNESQYINEINLFKKRTLKDYNDIDILSEEVVFDAYEICIDCQKQFDLYKKSKEFNLMLDEEMWVKCPNCSNTILPTLKFRFGIEVYNDDITQTSSSYADKITLNNPKNLKELLNLITKKEMGSNNSNISHFDIETFKSKYKKVFWNLVWYFQLMELDISFMLPYNSIKALNNECSSYNSTNHKFSIGKNIQLMASESQLERMSSITRDQLIIFDKEELREQQVYNFNIIPNIGMVPVLCTFDQNVSVFGYALNTHDMNSCSNDNLFSGNNVIIEGNCNIDEEEYGTENRKKENGGHHLQAIKEDYADNGGNEDEENNEADLNPYFDYELFLDHDEYEDTVTQLNYQQEDNNPFTMNNTDSTLFGSLTEENNQ